MWCYIPSFYMCTIQLIKYIIIEHHNKKKLVYQISSYMYVTLPLSVVPDLLEDQLYSKALWFLTYKWKLLKQLQSYKFFLPYMLVKQ
jgi:hypothetical protein